MLRLAPVTETDPCITLLCCECSQTFGAFLRCFGLALLNHKMYSSRSAKGVSLKSLELYALVFFFRLLSIMRHQGYLPFDKYGLPSLARSCLLLSAH